MSGGRLVGRSAELRAVADFLTSMTERPSALVIDGEAGIGKTTLWSATLQQARERGFRVFSARASQVESALAYAVVADLVSDVDCAALGGLPEVQRLSMDRVLLRADGGDPPSDHRVVATTILSISNDWRPSPRCWSPSTTCTGWTSPARVSSRSSRVASTDGLACWSPRAPGPTTAKQRPPGCSWPDRTV